MSWDLDVDEARELVEEFLGAMPPPEDDIWVITRVEEQVWGWIISWLNRRAAHYVDLWRRGEWPDQPRPG